MDADGPVFLAGDVAKLANQLLILKGGKTQQLRPLREGTGADAGGVRIVGEVVAWIGTDGDWDPEAYGFDVLLQ